MNSKNSIHHIKYKERDGRDEVLIISKREHQLCHNNRDELTGCFINGKNIPVPVHICRKAYRRELQKPQNRLVFYTSLGEHVRHVETIIVNPATGTICLTVGFMEQNTKRDIARLRK